MLIESLLLAGLGLLVQSGDRVVDERLHHLGNDAVAEWTGSSADPEGFRLDLTFESAARDTEAVLAIFHNDVHDRWRIELNDHALGTLFQRQEARVYHYAVPPGTLVEGSNRLSIFGDQQGDDIEIGRILLRYQTLREALQLGVVEFRVVDADTGQGLPARITLFEAEPTTVDLYYTDNGTTATRPGVCYTRDGQARLELKQGRYTAVATRGMEWSLARQDFEVRFAGPKVIVNLELRREVDTSGFVAADTHIHTLTYSGHGDSNLEERMLTLAGEGVELAISTDHNHNTDYRPIQLKTATGGFFTPIVGNEVTTDVGHFNAFPLEQNDRLPDHQLTDWIQLIQGMRQSGAKVVILNHPRWPQIETGPFGSFAFDPLSGSFAKGQRLPVDGIEIINSSWLLDDPLYKFRDWFALLNRGERIYGVGSSDSHTVGAPVGQGRTYVKSSTDDPAKISPDEACRSFQTGQTSMALGIFVDATLSGRVGLGGLAACDPDGLELALRVAAPGWIRPRSAHVFLNGQQVATRELSAEGRQPLDETLSIPIAAPAHDAHLVCVVLGEGVSGPWWKPISAYTLGATNPIFLDANGDGRYQSPRQTAARLIKERAEQSATALLAQVDAAVGLQMIDLSLGDGDSELRAWMAAAADGDSPSRSETLEYLSQRLTVR